MQAPIWITCFVDDLLHSLKYPTSSNWFQPAHSRQLEPRNFSSLASPLLGEKATINRMAILQAANPTTAPADRKQFDDARAALQ